MSDIRCGPLAAWANAFVVGRVSLDQVVDEATWPTDAAHRVDGLPDASSLRDLVVAWRRTGEPVRTVLPVPGDVRGLPGPAAFRDAALTAGEAVLAGELGAVPETVHHAPSSAPWDVTWTVWAVHPVAEDHVSLPDAQYDLTTAIRETAAALAVADVAGRGGDADALHEARRASERLRLPPGHPPRAVAVLAQAERMAAVLELALADPVGGAVDRMGMAARDSALRPLTVAVRRARLAGYNALAS